ncbi:hypothetical protein BKA69DRAFT_375631 [Paraphysoderma sedebokerense]|nr:hypothetical protein BKA69DRAFT_375631 [Paraphysoderma sedebokerense]
MSDSSSTENTDENNGILKYFGSSMIPKGTILYHGTRSSEPIVGIRAGMFLSFKLENAGYGGYQEHTPVYKYMVEEKFEVLNAWKPRKCRTYGVRCSLDEIWKYLTDQEEEDVKFDKFDIEKRQQLISTLSSHSIPAWVGVIERSNWGELVVVNPELCPIAQVKLLSDEEKVAVLESESPHVDLIMNYGTKFANPSADIVDKVNLQIDLETGQNEEYVMWSIDHDYWRSMKAD